MKHSTGVTLIVLSIFFISQLIGLAIINGYINQEELQSGVVSFTALPLGFERPEVAAEVSFLYIITAVIIGTLLILLIIRLKQEILWKLWFLLAIFITLNVAFGAFIPGLLATGLAVVFALLKTYKPNYYVHNFTEFFVYGGLAAIFVPILNIFSIIMLLFLISAYDAYAVWKSKHMVTLAKFQTNSKTFAGVIIPYKLPPLQANKKIRGPITKVPVKTAILGGGDIAFPLLFAGVMFKELILVNSVAISFAKVLVVPVFATIALAGLLYAAEKDKFYPAMPFISAGCLAAFVVMNIVGFL